MKLRKVHLKNFRGYKDSEFSISDLSAIIGRNDVGKSTILDALDIYFSDVAVEVADKCVYEDENMNIEIICAFEIEQNKPILLDTSVSTTLEEEHLLNNDGLLEISKVYECSGDKIKKPKIQILARHPSNFNPPLICLKINDLKKIAKENEVDVSNKVIKKEIRKSIFEQTKLKFDDNLKIDIDEKGDTDVKTIWDKLKNEFPLFLLFRADRTNTEKDKEVNDTTKAITKVAVQELQAQFEEMQKKVQTQIQMLANKTLSKLQTFDKEIADRLDSKIETKSLDSLFSFTFSSNDNIPFNKRGSGVRRLMILSFFLVEADRKNTDKNIIYAIEEPETSQHPDYQKRIMKSLKQLIHLNNRQVILTTHTHEMVRLVDENELIFIQKDNDSHQITVQMGNKIDSSKVIDTLGILPFVIYKGVIFVEGKTDIQFFKNINSKKFKEIFDTSKLTFIPLHGASIIDTWIKKNYLGKDTNIKCLFFHDKDDDASDKKTENTHIKKEIITKKREIENYFSPELIKKEFDIEFSREERDEWDNLRIAEKLQEKGVTLKQNDIKQRLQGKEIWKNISFSEGAEDEIAYWLKEMKTFFSE